VALFGADPGESGEAAGVPESLGRDAASTEPAPSADTVDDLFARLRAARADAVVRKAQAPTAETSPAQPAASTTTRADRAAKRQAETAQPAPAEEASASAAGTDRTDLTVDGDADEQQADLVPIIVAAARKLKRVLADEQNEVLDLLRRKEPVRSIDALLPWELDQGDRYANAVEHELADASAAGARGDSNGRDPSLYRPAGDAVTSDIVAPLRERLARAVDVAAGDNAALATQVRAIYREWKQHRIDEYVEAIVSLAFERGALTVPTA
ncbi:MAG TPA: hypothetical protein PLV68_07135, partial [Ilumatobacteraceae bacterium]|nr:hypothetical protein [Ilumatobacteraceae bacterium]